MKKAYIYTLLGLLNWHACHSALSCVEVVEGADEAMMHRQSSMTAQDRSPRKRDSEDRGSPYERSPTRRPCTVGESRSVSSSVSVGALVVFDPTSIIPAVAAAPGTGGGQLVTYLGTVVPTPRTFMAIGVDDHLGFLMENMTRKLGEMGVRNIQGKPGEAGGSSLFYSPTHNIIFLVTADFAQFSIFQGWNLSQGARDDQERMMVNRVIHDLLETTSTEGADVSSVGTLGKYIKPEVVAEATRARSLSAFLNVFYAGNKDFFERILEDLDPDSAFKRRLKSELKEAYEEDKADEEIYGRLVERQIFSTLLREKYVRDLQVHIDVYQAILAWQDLHRSLRLTCRLGAVGDASYGEDFCTAFIFPFLDLLLIDPHRHYHSVTSFYNNNLAGLGVNGGRMHVIKFKAPACGNVAAMALCGSTQNLRSLSLPDTQCGRRTKMLMPPAAPSTGGGGGGGGGSAARPSGVAPKERKNCSVM